MLLGALRSDLFPEEGPLYSTGCAGPSDGRMMHRTIDFNPGEFQ